MARGKGAVVRDLVLLPAAIRSGGDDDSASSGGSSSDASDIDRAELEALLDESRDVLTEGAAGGGGQLAKRARR